MEEAGLFLKKEECKCDYDEWGTIVSHWDCSKWNVFDNNHKDTHRQVVLEHFNAKSGHRLLLYIVNHNIL